jgi:hypothetical protein
MREYIRRVDRLSTSNSQLPISNAKTLHSEPPALQLGSWKLEVDLIHP